MLECAPAVAELSVCLSVKHVNCDKVKKYILRTEINRSVIIRRENENPFQQLII